MVRAKIDIGYDTIDYIVHIADVHIRNVHRHDEYNEVFDKVYAGIDEIKAKYPDKNGIIYLAGDIVHAKLDMSPELVHETLKLFQGCSSRLPTILVCGNHDANSKNQSRMDALTPMANQIQTNFHYLKESGIYTMADVDFIVWSVFQEVDDFILPKDVTGKNKKIVLFHGAVDGSDIGHDLTIQSKVKKELFDGCYAGLLGDIHTHQYLNGKRTIAYPGSLIQQNHGESLRHGYMFWDISDKNKPYSRFIEVPNDYGYYTVDIDNGEIVSLIDGVPKKSRMRIRVKNTSSVAVAQIRSELQKQYNPQDIRIQVITASHRQKLSTVAFQNSTMDDVRDVTYQSGLLAEILVGKYGVKDEDLVNDIQVLNANLNKDLPSPDSIRNVTWNALEFSFSNMFSYGENNVIDFRNMNGVVGLFAPNTYGKSSILDAMTFCLFDTCSRSFKASEIMNNKRDWFKCQFNISIGKDHYRITREGRRIRGNVRVDVNFDRVEYDENGDEILTSLNGVDRDKTNKVIRSYIGTYDDFILTALSSQNGNSTFIDKQQRDRKDLLSQFMDIGVFDELYTIANERLKELKAVLKNYLSTDYNTMKIDAEIAISGIDDQIKLHNEEVSSIAASIEAIEAEIRKNEHQRKPVNDALESFDVVASDNEISLLQSKRSGILTEVSSSMGRLTELQLEAAELQTNLDAIGDVAVIEDEVRRVNFAVSQLSHIEQDYNMSLRLVNDKKQLVKKLHSEHKYDPNCEYCMDNVFVRDALKANMEIPDDERGLVEIENKKKELTNFISSSNAIQTWESVRTIVDALDTITTRSIPSQDAVIAKHNANLLVHETKIQTLKGRMAEYAKFRGDIEHNKVLDATIATLSGQRKERIAKKDEVLSRIRMLDLERQKHLVSLETANQNIHTVGSIEREYEVLNLYVKCMHRDGIPKLLISNVLPHIENETNAILSGIVDFKVVFTMDEKNINTVIVYGDDRHWPLEMASGMERFAASLAIRTALINITSLPKPNFIAIDEGFGVADSTNLSAIPNLFDYLKNEFKFVLIISHIESMRDMVDSRIDIEKIDGVSSVNYR